MMSSSDNDDFLFSDQTDIEDEEDKLIHNKDERENTISPMPIEEEKEESQIKAKTAKLVHDVKDGEFYANLLKTAKHSGYLMSELPTQPVGGTIVILEKNVYKRNNPDCANVTDRTLMMSMRVDGYRFGKNHGSHKMKCGIYKTYTSIKGESDVLNKLFVRYEYRFPNGSHILFHYIGDHNEAMRISAISRHGNAKTLERPHTRTDPAALQVLREKFETEGTNVSKVYNEDVNSGKDSRRTSKSLKQVKNLAESERRKKRLSRDCLYNIFQLHESLVFPQSKQKFVSENSQFIKLAVPLLMEPLCDEMRMMNTIQSDPLIIHYDTQFNIGNQYVSTLTFTHKLFKGNKIVPFASLIHERKQSREHRLFVNEVFDCFPYLRKMDIVCVSDAEFNINKWISNVKTAHCWLHHKDNITRHLLHKLGNTNHHRILKLYEAIMYTKTEEEFDKEWNEIISSYPELFPHEVVEYFEGKAIPTFKEYSAVWYLRKIGVPNPERGITSNSAESWNSVLSKCSSSSMKIDDLITTIFYLATFFINELARGYYQLGKFELREEYCTLKKPPAEMPKLTSIPPVTDIVEFIMSKQHNKKEDEETDTEKTNDMEKLSHGIQPLIKTMIANGSVSILPYGTVLVKAPQSTAAVVIIWDSKQRAVFKCSCSMEGVCIHEEAARTYLNIDRPINKNSTIMKEAIRRAKKHRPGKKNFDNKRPISQPPLKKKRMDNNTNKEKREFTPEPERVVKTEESVIVDVQEQKTPNREMRKNSNENDKKMQNLSSSYYDKYNSSESEFPLKFFEKHRNDERILMIYDTVSFKNPLPAAITIEDRVIIFHDNESRIGCAKVLDGVVTLYVPVEIDYYTLSYLSSFMGRQQGLRTVNVNVNTLKMGTEIPPHYSQYDQMEEILDSLFCNMDFTHLESKTYHIYCSKHCYRSWTDELDKSTNSDLSIANLIQCDSCKDWCYQTCLGINAEEAELLDNFTCWNCIITMEVPSSGCKFAKNTCQTDAVIGLSAIFAMQDSKYIRKMKLGNDDEVNYALGLQLIQQGLSEEGQSHILNMCIKYYSEKNRKPINKENGIYDFYGSEDMLLNIFEHVHTIDATSVCSEEDCKRRTRTLKYNAHYVKRSEGENWTQSIYNLFAEEKECTSASRTSLELSTSSNKCIGRRKYSYSFVTSGEPWFVPVDMSSLRAPHEVVYLAPKEILIGGHSFVLGGATLYSAAHFRSVVLYYGRWYMIDNQNKGFLEILEEGEVYKNWNLATLYYFKT